MAKHPSATYLYRNSRSSNYFFRLRLPTWLQEVVCAGELRYILKTSNLTEAKYRAIKLLRFADELFKVARRKGSYMGDLSKDVIDRLMRDKLESMLAEAEESRIMALTCPP